MMGIYLFKNKRRAGNTALKVAIYFTDMPKAELSQAARHFKKSETWVRNYKNLAIRLKMLRTDEQKRKSEISNR